MTTDQLPSPPVPADCDLRNFQDMPLEVDTLRDSDLRRRSTGDEFKAALVLWAACWHQMPAGSLPDDDVELADLAGIGTGKPALRGWLKVKPMALRGWYKASDGRLYHPVMSRKAVEKWGVKQATKRKREQDADRLRTWRETHPETQTKRVSTPRTHGESRGESSRDEVSRGESKSAAAPPPTQAAAAGAMDQALADSKPAPQAPLRLNFADWRIQIGHRVFIGQDERREWEALFAAEGWDSMCAGYAILDARHPKPAKLFLSMFQEIRK